MCGRGVQASGPDQLGLKIVNSFEERDRRTPSNYPPRYKAAPSQDLWAIRQHPETGERSLDHELATVARTFRGLIGHLAARQKLEAQLVHMAHHDPLTGLLNRLLFRECLERELAAGERATGLRIREGGP